MGHSKSNRKKYIEEECRGRKLRSACHQGSSTGGKCHSPRSQGVPEHQHWSRSIDWMCMKVAQGVNNCENIKSSRKEDQRSTYQRHFTMRGVRVILPSNDSRDSVDDGTL